MESLLPVPRILPKDDSYKVYILKIYSPNSNGNVLYKFIQIQLIIEML